MTTEMLDIVQFDLSDYSTVTKVLAGVAIVLFLKSVWNIWKVCFSSYIRHHTMFSGWASQLRHIPTVGGPAIPVLSNIGSLNYLLNSSALLQKGYDKVRIVSSWHETNVAQSTDSTKQIQAYSR